LRTPKVLAFIAMAILETTPALARTEAQLPPGESYRNPPSGIVIDYLPGFTRKITSFDDNGLDVGLDFENDGSEGITLYIFRRVSGDAAVWLDRIDRYVSAQDRLGTVSKGLPEFAFERAGSTDNDVLAFVHNLSGRGLKSTGAAIIATSGWYVVIRATSNSKDADGLKAWLRASTAAIHFPANNLPIAAPDPIRPCSKPATWRDDASFRVPNLAAIIVQAGIANNIKGDMPKDLMENVKTGPWCWDSDFDANASIYRRGDNDPSYLIALLDAGRAFSVTRDSLTPIVDKSFGTSFFVKRLEVDHVDGFGSFEANPAPTLVRDKLNSAVRAYRANNWGEKSNIEINSDVVKAK
jgi:hypothetical protein